MTVFKCKMCGASLDIVEGSTVCQCEYCMTKQTLPKLTDEKRANLYDRANHFRRNNEFDKAMSIYENILNEDSTDAEAYWSLILCNYGIEYVEDPATKRRLPTVNRTQYTSIFDDENYKSAIANADFAQKSIYESEAKAINEIQKGILAISQKEKPFDVFICYKETDANGRRTPDSVLAQELYYGLKNEGFNVFFSRITLEDKLGSAYEPYIFAALNSAKVMVVLGTRQEHFNAVWVKNEWSRYLSLIKQGEKKTLIPAYRDMDPYDLPEEFSHLQAQDMSKLGFMQDLIRGVKKIVGSTSKSVEAPQTQNNDFDALLTRISLFLEDEEFERADEFCEQILNSDPKNAEAYIYKMLIEFKCHTKDELSSLKQSITNSKNYNKVIRFGNDEQIAYVKAVEDSIQAYFKKLREEEERKLEEERRKAEEFRRQQEEERKKAEELRRQQEEEANRESSAGLEFELNEDGKSYTLTKVGSCTEKNIVIDMHKGLPVTSIGYSAFSCCSNLTSIAIPNSVTSIGVWAFAMCSNLTSITIPNSVTSIGDGAFKECSNLTSITIPNSVTSIGEDAFSWCSNLTSITIPNSVTSIGEDAFSLCSNLTSITIPNSVTSIGERAFESCKNLTSITIPNSVTSIGDSAFRECSKLTNISVDANNIKYKSINGNLYTKDEKTLVCYTVGKTDKSFTIPNSVTSIGNSAFYECDNLTSIIIPNSVTSIGNSAFSYCEKLTSITIPNSVTSIGENAFSSCTNLKSITIPNSVTSIGVWAFFHCSNLTSITIPNSVTSIGNSAFSLCSNLTSITIPNSVTSIGEDAFSHCHIEKATLPAFALSLIPKEHLSCVTIIDGATSISNDAFKGCSNLTSITIPNSVTSIGEKAFSGCSNLTNITIPNSVTSIGHSAFRECTNLTSITIPNSVTSIGDYAFHECSNLTSITIPNSVTSVGKSAFSSCFNLTSIIMPNSVMSIGEYAFSGCSNLTSIYCFDNWDNIVGIKNAGISKEAKIFHYSEKKPSLKLFKRYWHYVDGVPTEW